MRMLMAVAVLLAFCFSSFAQEKPRFELQADGSVIEKRVDALEKRIAVLEAAAKAKTIASTGPVVLGGGPTTVTLEPVAPAKCFTYQVCTNGRCQTFRCDDLAKVPPGATNITEHAGVPVSTNTPASVFGIGNPCPTGPCGDNCGCSNANAVATGSDGWYLGKNLGRGRRGCSTCR